MPHPNLDNRTAFAADVLHLVDEEHRPLATLVVKATFVILPGGSLARGARQVGLLPAGEVHHPDRPEESSYRHEPEVAPFKPATDVALIGHAHAPRPRTTTMDIRLRVGPLMKQARVFGDRTWHRVAGATSLTAPATFEALPIVHERAFGGWDRSAEDPVAHRCEPRNPVGRGFFARAGGARDGVPAPNIEDIDHPIRMCHDAPPPAGFGFVSPHWQPRAGHAGTYDAAWRRGRCPLLPTDFDRRYFNAAAPGLIARGYLRGDEDVRADGLTPEGSLRFRLPGLPAPTARVVRAGQDDASPVMQLDTIVIDLDARALFMLWRVSVALRGGPHDLRAVTFECPASHALPRADTIAATRGAANQAT